MRVLFTSTAGVGHVTPMLPLARAFRDRGDEVRWAVPPSASGRLSALGFESVDVGDDTTHHPEDMRRRHGETLAGLPPEEIPNFLFAEIFGYDRTRRMLPDMLEVVGSFQPTLIVRDAAEFSASIAAAEHKIPCATHAFGALLPEARVARAGAAVAPLWEERGLEPAPYGGSYNHLYLDIYPPRMQPQERPHVRATQHIRPAPVSAGERVVAEGRPLVYVTFGTVFNATEPLATV